MSWEDDVENGFKGAVLRQLAEWLADDLSEELDVEELATYMANEAVNAIRFAKYKYQQRTTAKADSES